MSVRRCSLFPRRSQRGSSVRRASLTRRASRTRACRFEMLELRLALSAGSIDGRPYVDLGPSDNVAWDQPRVAVELLTDAAGTGSVGPGIFNTFLLDTGANSVLIFASAVAEMAQPPHPYQTEGVFEEFGVGGTQLFDISAPYRLDFAGSTGVRQTLLDARVISDANKDLSIFGPWGIMGMPAMAERVTELDFSPWTVVQGQDLFMRVDFADTLAQDSGHRYSVAVDNRVSFDPEPSVVVGDHPPIWADIPFMTGQLVHNDVVAEANMLFDTGAQISVMSTQLAKQLGLDSNLDGVLDEKDANFARTETVGGVGGTQTVPVFLFDEVHIPTAQGPDLVWTDLQWLVLDIYEGIDAVFGFDNMTTGWIEAFAVDGQSGNVMQSYLDFRQLSETGTGTIHLDLNPEVHQVIDPSGPGAQITESGGSTAVSETGVPDSYQIRLTQPPLADVTIALVNQDGQVVAVDSANPENRFLVFTPANWNVFQTVRVSAVDDELQEGFRRSWIKHESSSSDPAYQDAGMPRVMASVVDNDFAGVMFIPSGGSTDVAEGGASDTYDVVLTRRPSSDVTISLENVPGQVTAVDAGSPTAASFLVFTSENWDVPQTVLVSAVDDDQVEGPHRAYITHRIDTLDDEYQQTFAMQESVWISDNDGGPPNQSPSVTAIDASVRVNEGQTLINSGSFLDADVGDSVTLTASVGTIIQTSGNAGSWTWQLPTSDDLPVTTVTVTADDGKGGVGVATFQVQADNAAPAPSIDAISAARVAGTPVDVTASAVDPAGANDTLTYVYEVSKNGSTFANGSGVDLTGFRFTPDQNGSYEIAVTVSDEDGGSAVVRQTITVETTVPTGIEANLTANPPTIAWTPTGDASYYNVWLVRMSDSFVYSGRIEGSAFKPNGTLLPGAYRMFVSAVSAAGISRWSAPYDFYVGASTPPAAPSGFTVGGSPRSVQWKSTDTATHYDAWLVRMSNGQHVPTPRVTNAALDVSNLPADSYRVFVKAGNAAGQSGWSAPFDFHLGPAPVAPTAPTGLTAQNTDTPRPTLQWQPVSGATGYAVWVVDLSSGQLAASDATLTTSSFTPAAAWTNGAYRYFVRAFNGHGSSRWAGHHDFVVDAAPAPMPWTPAPQASADVSLAESNSSVALNEDATSDHQDESAAAESRFVSGIAADDDQAMRFDGDDAVGDVSLTTDRRSDQTDVDSTLAADAVDAVLQSVV